jgi:hypothetical protein
MEQLARQAVEMNTAVERGEGVGGVEVVHTADSLFEQGREELATAEANEIEAHKYVTPSLVGVTDDPACDTYHEHENRPFLSQAFRKMEPRINTLVPIGRWYVDGGSMSNPYNMGRKWGVPR